MTETVEVTQADRDAAHRVWGCFMLREDIAHIRLCEAFARHSLAAIEAARPQIERDALERAAKVAEDYPSPLNDLPMAFAMRDVAAAITALAQGEQNDRDT